MKDEKKVEDRLITAQEVRKILKISSSTLSTYTRKGYLTGYYLPDSKIKRFWLSEVRSLPQKGAV